MPQTRICRSTVCEVSEPPSRRSQYAVVEALATAAIDGNIYSFLSMLCGSINSPLVILGTVHLAALIIAFLYGSQALSFLAEHTNFMNSQGYLILFPIILQGIGYCLGEIIHTKSSRLIRRCTYLNDTALALVAKNAALVALGVALYTSLVGYTCDIVYGALYACVIGTLHDIVRQTPLLKKAIRTLAQWCLAIIKKGHSLVTNKEYKKVLGYSFLATIAVASNVMYASESCNVQIPYFLFLLAPLLNMLEQAVLYEYTYRYAFVGYKKIHHLVLYGIRQIGTLLKRLHLPQQTHFSA